MHRGLQPRVLLFGYGNALESANNEEFYIGYSTSNPILSGETKVVGAVDTSSVVVVGCVGCCRKSIQGLSQDKVVSCTQGFVATNKPIPKENVTFHDYLHIGGNSNDDVDYTFSSGEDLLGSLNGHLNTLEPGFDEDNDIYYDNDDRPDCDDGKEDDFAF